jgi:hypothetical protein
VARILDINTAKVWKTSKKTSSLKSLDELISVSEHLADELFGCTKELSTYAYGDNKNNETFISKIENRDNFTIVTFKYFSKSATQIGIDRSTYIEDMATLEKYTLLDASNINIIDLGNTTFKNIDKGIHEYSLFFERIQDDVTNITIIEQFTGNETGWIYKDITLRPYGQKGLYVFEYNDNIETEYNNFINSLVYEINFQNKKWDAQIIYINGKWAGKIPANSTKTFTVSIYDYGQVKAVQAEGYLFVPRRSCMDIKQQPTT